LQATFENGKSEGGGEKLCLATGGWGESVKKKGREQLPNQILSKVSQVALNLEKKKKSRGQLHHRRKGKTHKNTPKTIYQKMKKCPRKKKG